MHGLLLLFFLTGIQGYSPRWLYPEPRTVKINTGRRRGPCGDGDRSEGPEPIELKPGPLTLTWEEPVNNKGSLFRIALSRDGEDSFEQCILVNNIPHNDAGNPVYEDDKTYTEYSLTVDIPDVKCDDCALQLVNIVPGKDACNYDPNDTENDLAGRCSTNYHSCANVKIVGGKYDRNDFTCKTADWAFSNGNAYAYEKKSASWMNNWLVDKQVPASFRHEVPMSEGEEGKIVAVINNRYDDAQESLATDKVQRTNTEIEFNAKFVVGLRFREIPLPTDMEILDARLTLWMSGGGAVGNNTDSKKDEGLTTFTISFEKSGDAKEIEVENLDITSRDMVSEDLVVTGHLINSQTGQWTSQNLKELVQSIVDGESWESGNALMTILDIEGEGGPNKMLTYESDRPAELSISYRSKAAVGTYKPTTSPTQKNVEEQPCTYAYRDRVRGNFMGRGDWYSGRIDKVHENKNDIKDQCTYDVVYDDGDFEEGMVNDDLEVEDEHDRTEFQIRELVDVNVGGEWKRGQVRILQKNGKYTVETEDGEVHVDRGLKELRQWVEWFVGDKIEIRQCWWFEADIVEVVPDGRYLCRETEEGYMANVPYSDIREILDVRYQSGDAVKLYMDGKWVDGFVIQPNEEGNTYMVGVIGSTKIELNWPGKLMSKAEGR